VDSGIITPAVLEWAERVEPGARVADCTVQPLAGGAVARQVDRLTLHLAGGPVQYLPWTIGRRPTPAAEAALDQIAQALDQLPA
jgi:hypothetical protein